MDKWMDAEGMGWGVSDESQGGGGATHIIGRNEMKVRQLLLVIARLSGVQL